MSVPLPVLFQLSAIGLTVIAFLVGFFTANFIHARDEKSYKELCDTQREYIVTLEKGLALHRKMMQEINDTINEPPTKSFVN